MDFKFNIGDHVSFVYGSVYSPSKIGVFEAVVNGGEIISRRTSGDDAVYRVSGFSGWWSDENLVLVSRGTKNSPKQDEVVGPNKDQGSEPKRDVVENTAVWVWHEADEYFTCSKCQWSALNDYRGRSTDSRFCPHCGRQMLNSTQPEEDDA